jgi:hypothetical protein
MLSAVARHSYAVIRCERAAVMIKDHMKRLEPHGMMLWCLRSLLVIRRTWIPYTAGVCRHNLGVAARLLTHHPEA